MSNDLIPKVGTNGIPDTDIQNQLQRMLASPRFRNAENQADFLKLVVERALQGKKTPGKIVADALFPHKEEINVRATANNLRKTLKDYYSREGLADLVVIALPEPPKDRTVKLREGEAYTPTFSYNPQHAVAEAIRLGNYHLARATYADVEDAFEYFLKALEAAPGNIHAAIGIAEALCGSLYWTANDIDESDRDELLKKVGRTLGSVAEEADGYWRFHAAAGMFFVIISEMSEAKESFDKALALDRSAAEIYPAYLGYLVATERPAEAVRLAQRYVESQIDNAGAYATCAMTMLVAESFPEAIDVVKRALKLDKGHPGVRIIATMLKLLDVPGFESQELRELTSILDDQSYDLLKREFLRRGAPIRDPDP